MRATVEFCGEQYPIEPGSPLIIGREGGLAIDDNPYLHRRFLHLGVDDDLVWLANIGSQLTATVADEAGLMQAWLSPGARVPVVFPRTVVWFTAGPTTYEFDIVVPEGRFQRAVTQETVEGDTTVGRMTFTPDQKLLIVVLSENVLRRGNRGAGAIPPNTAAAARLGWTLTKFNRKLDNVCDKLTRAGIRGLRGDAEKLATNRRARLVEYALAAQLVTATDLELLDGLTSSRQ